MPEVSQPGSRSWRQVFLEVNRRSPGNWEVGTGCFDLSLGNNPVWEPRYCLQKVNINVISCYIDIWFKKKRSDSIPEIFGTLCTAEYFSN